MLRIAVVDDEEQMRASISQTIAESLGSGLVVQAEDADKYLQEAESILTDDELEAEQNDKGKIGLFTFSNAEAFIEQVRRGMKMDILFTDIQMGIMDGMELGKTLRELQPDLYIIFITSYAEYAAQSYVIGAYQYILKQDMDYRIPIVVRHLVDKIKRRNNAYRMVGTLADKKRIYCRDIIYVHKEKGGKYADFVTLDGIYRERIPLERLYQEIEDDVFILVERSHIINMERIEKLTGNVIYMENGDEIKISRARLPGVKRAIDCYWRKR